MVRLYRLDNIDTKENALPGGKGVRSLGSESRAFYIFFFAPQGLQGFFAAHGFFALQGPQAAIWTSVSAEMPAAGGRKGHGAGGERNNAEGRNCFLDHLYSPNDDTETWDCGGIPPSR
jgi:hypothetical protein